MKSSTSRNRFKKHKNFFDKLLYATKNLLYATYSKMLYVKYSKLRYVNLYRGNVCPKYKSKGRAWGAVGARNASSLQCLQLLKNASIRVWERWKKFMVLNRGFLRFHCSTVEFISFSIYKKLFHLQETLFSKWFSGSDLEGRLERNLVDFQLHLTDCFKK